MKHRMLLPFALFIAVLALLGYGLTLKPAEIPSPLLGQSAPAFALPSLADGDAMVTPAALAGQPWLLNVWASWCAACLDEHPLLNELATRHGVAIIGLNYKDKPADARTWLQVHGNPYTAVAVDREGNTGIEYGVYGVPETFVIDRAGVVQMKHIGPLTAAVIAEKLLPLVGQLSTAR